MAATIRKPVTYTLDFVSTGTNGHYDIHGCLAQYFECPTDSPVLAKEPEGEGPSERVVEAPAYSQWMKYQPTE